MRAGIRGKTPDKMPECQTEAYLAKHWKARARGRNAQRTHQKSTYT